MHQSKADVAHTCVSLMFHMCITSSTQNQIRHTRCWTWNKKVV